MSAYLTGAGRTPYGRQPGSDSLAWQLRAAELAVDDAGVDPDSIDAVVCGYSTTSPHLMPANLFAEAFGVEPQHALGVSVGGATGLAMVAEAQRMVLSGSAREVLVVAGENRASGMTRADATATLAQVGHAAYEVPLGGNVPAYYALLASRYLWSHELDPSALSAIPVQMRQHAMRTPGAHFRTPIDEDDVLTSRPVADPLRLLDCCPVSDGAAGFVVSARPHGPRSVEIVGSGAANRCQHVTALQFGHTGAGMAAARALADAGLSFGDISVFGIYDSFSITAALIIEELGLAPDGAAGSYARAGAFDVDGRYPANTHGGLLSYGHCGVAGGMAHLAEVVTQLRGERGEAQVKHCTTAYVHADGGVLSAHVGLVLSAAR